MKQTKEIQFIMRCCSIDHRLDVLKTMETILENCQKVLKDYLDSKRDTFSRFYFLSNNDLLSILGGKDLEIIQKYVVNVCNMIL